MILMIEFVKCSYLNFPEYKKNNIQKNCENVSDTVKTFYNDEISNKLHCVENNNTLTNNVFVNKNEKYDKPLCSSKKPDENHKEMNTFSFINDNSNILLLNDCKNKIKNFIDQKKLKLDLSSKITNKNVLNHEDEALLKVLNHKIHCFRNNYIYNLKKSFIPKISFKITKITNIYLEYCMNEMIDILDLVCKVFDKREPIIKYKLLSFKNTVLTIEYNIEIMSIFKYVPIIEIMKNIRKNIVKEYEQEEIFSSVTNVINKFEGMNNKAEEVIKMYEMCIEIFKKK
ncbi:uncharacterized protein VNE69_08034 [Vairimorpha necatrix]|uniref:Uncharacterized protein n=1 Tax=Vairimorpha necatrix TaxID=6039 RepID=A0AAX4JEF7_9MICR